MFEKEGKHQRSPLMSYVKYIDLNVNLKKKKTFDKKMNIVLLIEMTSKIRIRWMKCNFFLLINYYQFNF